MKRSDYLKLCVSAAMLTYRKPKVLYAGIEYYPEGYKSSCVTGQYLTKL